MKIKLIALILFMALPAFAESPTTPKLFFSYSWLFDSMCGNTPERQIEDAWAEEARAKVPEFQKLWDDAEPVLFGKVYELFGSGFSRKEMTATLTVCRVPSFSDPLTLNITRYLKSFMGEKPVASNEEFTNLVFHELLHTWIVEHTDWPTPMIRKYMNELPATRNHLHLMALQKLVYQKLNRQDLVDLNASIYARNPPYKRAWEIVELEGVEAFTSEFQK